MIIPSIAEIPVSSFVPALITATVAIFLFIVNQWLLFITKRSEVLREKLEQLWMSLLVISRQTRPITAYGDDEEMNEEIARNLHERATLLIESLLEPTTFIALYFPDLKCKYSRITKTCGVLTEVMRRPPLAKPLGASSLASTYVEMMKKPGYFKELRAASKNAKKEIGDLQVYMRENQSILIRTLAGIFKDKCL